MSFTQTQDGYLKTINTSLTRMGELSLLAQDATLSNTDRNLYDKEFQQLKDFLSRSKTKQFNGVDLFSANNTEVSIDSSRNSFVIPPIDLNSEAYAFVDADTDDEDAETVNLKTLGKAKESMTFVSKAVSQVALDRAQIGAIQSRLQFTNAHPSLLEAVMTCR